MGSRVGGGDDGDGDFFAFFEFRNGWRLDVGGLRGGGDDEGEVRDSVVVVGGEEVVEVGGEKVDTSSIDFRVGFKPLWRVSKLMRIDEGG